MIKPRLISLEEFFGCYDTFSTPFPANPFERVLGTAPSVRLIMSGRRSEQQGLIQTEHIEFSPVYGGSRPLLKAYHTLMRDKEDPDKIVRETIGIYAIKGVRACKYGPGPSLELPPSKIKVYIQDGEVHRRDFGIVPGTFGMLMFPTSSLEDRLPTESFLRE